MKDVKQLHPTLQVKVATLKAKCSEKGYVIGISECLRTVAEQDALYAKGRTAPGSIVTNAKGSTYSSMHQWGVAFDFYRNDGKGAYYDNDGFFTKVGRIGQSIGLEWGGAWKSIVDKPHFQLPDWGSTPSKLKVQYGTPSKFIKSWGTGQNYSDSGSSSTVSDTSTNTESSTGTGSILAELPQTGGNSSLATYVNRISSSNYSQRTVLISCITVHTAKKKGSIEDLAKMINSSEQCYNYGIGNDGTIGLFVDENMACNSTGNKENDNRSVNIICMNSSLSPNYAISSACYKSLVQLCEDICMRNYIYALKYNFNKPKNTTLTTHDQFQKIDCPGKYFKDKIVDFVKAVNKRLAEEDSWVTVTTRLANSETAALRAQSTVSIGAIKPYVLRPSTSALKIDYKAMKSMGVVGVMLDAGYLFDERHNKVNYRSANLWKQTEEVLAANLPFGYYYTTRAKNINEVIEEGKWFRIILNAYPPKLGGYVRCDLSVSKALAKAFIEKYYSMFVEWGLKSKCGICATKSQAELIGWPAQCNYMTLWLEESLDKDVKPSEELLQPAFFKLDDLSNAVDSSEKDVWEGTTIQGTTTAASGTDQTTNNSLIPEPEQLKSNSYTTFTLPKNVPHYKGMKKWMSYTEITTKTSLQWKITHSSDMLIDEDGFCRVKGRYLIAVGTGICNTVGTYIEVCLDNGKEIHCIVGDIKKDCDTDSTNVFSNGTSNWCCSEFLVTGEVKEKLNRDVRIMGDCSYRTLDWRSPVVKFKVSKKNWFNGK